MPWTRTHLDRRISNLTNTRYTQFHDDQSETVRYSYFSIICYSSHSSALWCVVQFTCCYLLSVTAICSDAVKTVFKEVKGEGATVCDVVTSQEGKHTYKGGSQASACCTVGGIERLLAGHYSLYSEVYEQDGKKLCAASHLAANAHKRSDVATTTNAHQVDKGRNLCTERTPPTGYSVSVELKSDSCVDKSKRFHVKISVKKDADSKESYTGDACCDTNKIHMINYTEHCCSVSNTPILRFHPLLTPPCCARPKALENDFAQYLNGPVFGGEPKTTLLKGPIRFCSDGLSGAYNVTKNLSRRRALISQPSANTQYKLNCCKKTNKVAFLNKVCCGQHHRPIQRRSKESVLRRRLVAVILDFHAVLVSVL